MSQNEIVLEHLQTKGPITQAIAAKEYNIWRLASIVHRLKASGKNIICETVPTANGRGTFGRYHLIGG